MTKYSVKDAPKYVVVSDRGLVIANTVTKKEAEAIAERRNKREKELANAPEPVEVPKPAPKPVSDRQAPA